MTTDVSPTRHAPVVTGGLDTPPSREQLDALARLLRAGSDPHRVAALLEADGPVPVVGGGTPR
ncbi:hypothetical protein [Saccharomonospora iraqiensis]|uniref:hypothetical protein n=1 Tax=Saccharomonospora iraqiensis TaxID=52698 RepID=UPI00022E0B08|nr:hypothetical protein [Saccharomonospora iraqiensis]